MRARLAGLMVTLAVALVAAPHSTGALALGSVRSGNALTAPVCPAGTNWDNTLHVCR
jgi:hypothetical protein